MKDGQILRKDN